MQVGYISQVLPMDGPTNYYTKSMTDLRTALACLKSATFYKSLFKIVGYGGGGGGVEHMFKN